ncbi:hypothetical protein HKD37_17G048108 [Glycine soja]
MFTTVNAKDHTYGKVSRSFVIRWKDQLERYWYLIDKNENIYAYCCVQQRFGWTTLRNFYGLNGDHQVIVLPRTIFKTSSDPNFFQNDTHYTIKNRIQSLSSYCKFYDVPSSMYYFMKEKRFIDLVLEDGSKCRIVYNDWRKTAKIGYGWRVFS